jgi:hypothetical protein
MTRNYPLPPIHSIEDLKREQKKVKLRLQQQEVDLKQRVREIPGEFAKSAVSSLIPSFLSGRISNTALDGLRSGINWFFSKDKTPQNGGELIASLAQGIFKQVGWVGVLKMAAKLFQRKAKSK